MCFICEIQLLQREYLFRFFLQKAQDIFTSAWNRSIVFIFINLSLHETVYLIVLVHLYLYFDCKKKKKKRTYNMLINEQSTFWGSSQQQVKLILLTRDN